MLAVGLIIGGFFGVVFMALAKTNGLQALQDSRERWRTAALRSGHTNETDLCKHLDGEEGLL